MINQRLIVAAAGLVHFAAKPVKNLFVQTDRDAALAARGRYHRAWLAFTEIVFLFQVGRIVCTSVRIRKNDYDGFAAAQCGKPPAYRSVPPFLPAPS